jgi:DNA processing protein
MAAALQSTDRLAPDELSAWLRLLLTPGVGRTTARRLLAACGGAQTSGAARRPPGTDW